MPLGNPIRKQNESRIISVLATEGQSVFTVEGGYIINQISVFRNGVRLSNSEDFTAGDGSTVTLNDEANVDDRIEFQIFDRFTVQNAIIGAASTQTISGDLVINGKIFGNLDVPSINTGIITAGGNINANGNIIGDNSTNISGISSVTATGLFGALTGNVTGDVTGNADTATVASNVTVADESSDTTCHPLFSTTNTGNAAVKVGSNLSFNSSSGALSATSFVGDGSALTGLVADKIFEGNTEAEVVDTGSDGHFKVTTEGSERLRVDAQGRLQVGSTNNTATGTKFVVGVGNNMTATALINTQDTDINALTLSNWDGSTTTNKVIVGFDNSGRGSFSMGMPATSADFIFASSIDGASSERMRISGSNGSVTIGKTSNQGKALEIYQASDAALRIQNSSTGTTSSDGILLEASGSNALLYNYEAGHLAFGTSGTERLRVSSSGKVRVGSGDATYNLEVLGSGQQVILVGSTNASGAYLTLDGDSNGDGSGGDYSYIGHNTSGNLEIAADNPSGNAVLMFKTGDQNEKMRLDSSGRLLLAATSGTARLHIKGNGGDGIKIENSGGTNAACIDLKNTLSSYVKEYRIAVAGSDGLYGTASSLFVRDQTSGQNRFEVQSGGNVKISTGNLIIGTAGKGIDFGTATPDSGGTDTSEVLDDYEEGSCNPTQTNGSFTASASDGKYTKVGRLVTWMMHIVFDTTASGNHARIGNLPFTSDGARAGASILRYSDHSDSYKISWHVDGGTSTASAYYSSGGGAVPASAVSGRRYDLTFVYEAAS